MRKMNFLFRETAVGESELKFLKIALLEEFRWYI
jgi:hypothetical protein